MSLPMYQALYTLEALKQAELLIHNIKPANKNCADFDWRHHGDTIGGLQVAQRYLKDALPREPITVTPEP